MELKVIHAIAGLGRISGGPSQAVSDLCTALALSGVQTEIATTTMASSGGMVVPDSQHVTTTIAAGYFNGAAGFGWSSQFKRVLTQRCRTMQAEIIHGHGIWMQVNHATAAVARNLKTPLLISPHGMLTPWSLRFKSFRKRVAMSLYQWRDLQTARVLHATGELEAANLRAVGLKMPIAIIPIGIDIPPWQAPQNGQERRTALFLGRIHPVKGLLSLVEAWSNVKPAGWRMVLVGPDADGYKSVVEKAVRDAGLEDVFTFLPAVQPDAKWAMLRTADLVILPSHTENFGLVVGEALACGIPVITTQGTPWEKMAVAGCGWWIEVGAAPLAAALREATETGIAQLREMGLRGRRMIERDFDWKVIGDEMKLVYEWILGGGAPPQCLKLD